MTATGDAVELSVVIAMRDAATTVGSQLEALRSQAWAGSWEVVVADNGSRDGGDAVVAGVAEADPRIRLIDASAVAGPAAARNAGARAARGRHLAFCDADDLVGGGWLQAVAEALRVGDAVTGPQEQDRLNERWLAGVHGRAVDCALQWFDGIFPYGPSANLAIRREVFEDLGGFDEGIAVGEDLDLCLRLWRAGRDLVFAPGALVHYRNRATLGALFRQAVRYGAAGPMIVRRLRATGGPTPSRVGGLRTWLWLVRALPTLRSRAGRARWLVVAGRSVGRAIGSIRQRTLYL